MFTTAEIKDFVANSADLLDKEIPGWERKINLVRLNMNEQDDCIAGQLKLTGKNPDDLGYVFLKQLWKAEIQRRLGND